MPGFGYVTVSRKLPSRVRLWLGTNRLCQVLDPPRLGHADAKRPEEYVPQVKAQLVPDVRHDVAGGPGLVVGAVCWVQPDGLLLVGVGRAWECVNNHLPLVCTLKQSKP